MGATVDRVLRQTASVRYWREDQARVVVEAWRRSGEPLRQFAARIGVDARRIERWGRRLGSKSTMEVRLHPVRLVGGSAGRGDAAAGLELETPDGHIVRLPAGFSAEDLQRLLGTLRTATAC